MYVINYYNNKEHLATIKTSIFIYRVADHNVTSCFNLIVEKFHIHVQLFIFHVYLSQFQHAICDLSSDAFCSSVEAKIHVRNCIFKKDGHMLYSTCKSNV